MKKPRFTVIIPVLSVNEYITNENLPAHAQMTYDNFEVIVLPNKKTKADYKLEKEYSWLRIIATGKVTRPAKKRDIGAKRAQGTILAFIDDDAYPTTTWLTKAAAIFEKKRVAAVCGPGILPPGAIFWEKVFDEVLKTWIGSGGYSYRFIPQKKRFVDDYPSMNFLIRRDLFMKLGGFNSHYWPGEDSKLCEDLVHSLDEKIIYDPKVVIYHHRRDNLFSYLKQHGQYGYHRGAFFAHGDRNSRRLSYLVPTFFVVYLSILLILFFLYPILNIKGNILHTLFFPFVLYVIGLTTVMITAFKNTHSLQISLISAIVIFLMHITYGMKFIQGLVMGVVKKEQIY